MTSNVFGIILAGGSGSRLWPLSREMFPKQLLSIYNESDETLFQQTVKLISHVVDKNNLISITNVKHESDLKIQYSQLYPKKDDVEDHLVIIEPVSRNTAAAICASTFYITRNLVDQNTDPIIIVSPSDHLILDTTEYISILEKAIHLADQGFIVTLGIQPDKPETAYGYIKVVNNTCKDYFEVDKFVEKPSCEKANEFIKQGNYYWNSGLFIFKASTLLDELKEYCFDLYKGLKSINYSTKLLNYQDYVDLPDISIDYAVMEKSQKLVLLPANIGWSDLGSWLSVFEKSQKDQNNNFISGNIISINCKNSLIYSANTLMATVGINNMVVVNTDDATLICDINNTQEVKTIFNELKERKDTTYKYHKTQLRPWGYHTLLKEDPKYKIRYIYVKPLCKSSLHMHYHKNKHWTVVDGIARVTVNDKEFYLHPGESLDIKATEKHRIFNPGKIDLKIIEVQTGFYLEDDDIVRFDEKTDGIMYE